MIERKNYSFYMPTDFSEKIEKVQAHDNTLKSLSKSQAVYFIISNLAKAIDDGVDPEDFRVSDIKPDEELQTSTNPE